MVRYSTFQRRVLLSASTSEVYSFHENPHNITKISPSFLNVEHVECTVPAKSGEEFRLKLSLFGIAFLSMEWIGIWEVAQPTNEAHPSDALLVDGAKKSPFLHWRHHHLFRSVDSGSEMTDRVEYALYGGIFGRLLDVTVMRVIFEIMFLGRHLATRKYFAATAR